MDSWAGQLHLSEGRTVKDIHVYSPHKGRPQPIPHNATLAFVSVVELCLVPLHLVAGPSCVLWTGNSDTEAWFRDQLLREPNAPESGLESWFDVSNQSYAGILASVESEQVSLNMPPITDILFFAMAEPSSSEDPGDRCLQVRAVPLAYRLQNLPSMPVALATQNISIDNGYPNPQKTPSLDIFEAATEIRRRSKGRGGIEVAAAAAGLSQARLLVGHKKSKGAQSQSANTPIFREAPQISTKQKASGLIENIDRHQFLARSSGLTETKQAADQPTLPASSSQSKDLASLEHQNKDAISRLVMAGMRLHGYQPRQKKVKLAESATVEETQSFSSDEHKLVYHQTYKAVTFIFVSRPAD
jgi:hypothetical protein